MSKNRALSQAGVASVSVSRLGQSWSRRQAVAATMGRGNLANRLMTSAAAMVLATLGMGLAGGSVVASPLASDATVVAGRAVVSNPTATSTVVSQSSDRAVLDWKSFDVPVDHSVEFIVPTDSGATLNRINSGGVSLIQGTVSSNGAVYFVNPNGLIFDATSRVSANGFLATTAAIGNFDFMTGSPKVSDLRGAGTGSIALMGTVVGSSASAYAQDVFLTGTVDTSNRGADATGGNVALIADRFTGLGKAAVISASGANGGGSVNIGGNFQGDGLFVNGTNSLVMAGASINVDATVMGNAGNVVVWAEDTTEFGGKISARGGAKGGNGGMVEVSGKINLGMTGLVDSSAKFGKSGQLLLDPTIINIVETGAGFTTSGTLTETPTALPTNWGGNYVPLQTNGPPPTPSRDWTKQSLLAHFFGSANFVDKRFNFNGAGTSEATQYEVQPGTVTFSILASTLVNNLKTGNVVIRAETINVKTSVISVAGTNLKLYGKITVDNGVTISNLGGDLTLQTQDFPKTFVKGASPITFGSSFATGSDKIVLKADNILVSSSSVGEQQNLTHGNNIVFNTQVDFVLNPGAKGKLTLQTGQPWFDSAAPTNPNRSFSSGNLVIKENITVMNAASVVLDLGGAGGVAGAAGGGKIQVDTGKKFSIENSTGGTLVTYLAAGVTDMSGGLPGGNSLDLATGVLLMVPKSVTGNLYINNDAAYQ
ncbi:MAG: filamentous hemagglutinin N-terminal domain-containing protein, partial [Alphaproteobacteria bacterium]|nr:filamentous hemagglutinin N-terminal domain-containing protein [Alphaproteobacteria bacterium]